MCTSHRVLRIICMYVCGRSLCARSLLIRRPAGRRHGVRWLTIFPSYFGRPPLSAGVVFLSYTHAHSYIKYIVQQPSLPNPRSDPTENKGLEKQQHRRLPPVKDKHSVLGLNMFPPYILLYVFRLGLPFECDFRLSF